MMTYLKEGKTLMKEENLENGKFLNLQKKD